MAANDDDDYLEHLEKRRLTAVLRRPMPGIETSLAKGLPDPGEGPTPERLKIAGDDIEEFTPAEAAHYRTIRMLDAPLDKLRVAAIRYRKDGITADQYNAGCRYYATFYRAGLSNERAQDLSVERVDGGGFKDITETVLAARNAHNKTLKILDSDSLLVLSEVVIKGNDLNDFADARFRHCARRERRFLGRYLIRKALDQLVKHYWPPRRDGIVGQARPDARPTIQPPKSES
jgi:hypothetical protein